MTLIESLPVDNYNPTDTEIQLANILFPEENETETEIEKPQQQKTEELELSQPQPQPQESCCPLTTRWWDMIMDILLILFGILLFQSNLWVYIFNESLLSSSKAFWIKLVILILFVILIKKFIFR